LNRVSPYFSGMNREGSGRIAKVSRITKMGNPKNLRTQLFSPFSVLLRANGSVRKQQPFRMENIAGTFGSRLEHNEIVS